MLSNPNALQDVYKCWSQYIFFIINMDIKITYNYYFFFF